MNKNSIVLTGGGTAGHCIPCLSLLPELEKSFDKIYYVGSENGVEKKLATDAGLTYFSVPCVKLVRKLTLKNLAVPFTLVKGVTEAKKLLEKIRPDVVFSKGGYVALPVCLAAEKLKIPTVLHESDLSLGLANRLARKKATLLLTGFGQTAENYPRAVFTGNPLRRELLQKRDRRAIIDKYGFKEQKPVLLVIGGSQGAGKINDALRNSLDKLLENFCILHIAGKNKTSGIKRDGYYETEYVSDMGAAFAAADVCVSRAEFARRSGRKRRVLRATRRDKSSGRKKSDDRYFYKRDFFDLRAERLSEKSMRQNRHRRCERKNRRPHTFGYKSRLTKCIRRDTITTEVKIL